jgi:hypothetical protein
MGQDAITGDKTMSILIKAGWSKKCQLEPFGSDGTFVSFDVEVDDVYLQPEKKKELLEQVRTLQMLAKNAVELELSVAATKARDIAALAEEEAARRHDDERDAEVAHRTLTGERPLDGATRSTARRDEPEHAPPPRMREGTYRSDRDEVEYHDDDRPTRSRDERPARDERPRERNDDRPRRGYDGRGDRGRSGGGGGGGGRGKRDWRDGGTPKSGVEFYGYVKDWNKNNDGAWKWFDKFGVKENYPEQFSDWERDQWEFAIKEYHIWRNAPAQNGSASRTNGAAY